MASWINCRAYAGVGIKFGDDGTINEATISQQQRQGLVCSGHREDSPVRSFLNTWPALGYAPGAQEAAVSQKSFVKPNL